MDSKIYWVFGFVLKTQKKIRHFKKNKEKLRKLSVSIYYLIHLYELFRNISPFSLKNVWFLCFGPLNLKIVEKNGASSFKIEKKGSNMYESGTTQPKKLYPT